MTHQLQTLFFGTRVLANRWMMNCKLLISSDGQLQAGRFPLDESAPAVLVCCIVTCSGDTAKLCPGPWRVYSCRACVHAGEGWQFAQAVLTSLSAQMPSTYQRFIITTFFDGHSLRGVHCLIFSGRVYRLVKDAMSGFELSWRL